MYFTPGEKKFLSHSWNKLKIQPQHSEYPPSLFLSSPTFVASRTRPVTENPFTWNISWKIINQKCSLWNQISKKIWWNCCGSIWCCFPTHRNCKRTVRNMEVKFSWGNVKSNMFSFIKWYLQIKNKNLKKTSLILPNCQWCFKISVRKSNDISL